MDEKCAVKLWSDMAKCLFLSIIEVLITQGVQCVYSFSSRGEDSSSSIFFAFNGVANNNKI